MMKFNSNYSFKISCSRIGYNDKNQVKNALSQKTASAYGIEKLSFREEYITVEEFLSRATNGFCFCNLFNLGDKEYTFKNGTVQRPFYKTGAKSGYFKLTFKSDRFFRGTQAVFVDIDYTKYSSIEAFCEKLKFKPTCAYYSYSDSLVKIDVNQKENPLYTEEGIYSRRFRLVYIFDEILTRKEVELAAKTIYECIELNTREYIQDKCGEKVSQYFNGSQNKNTYFTGCIYNKLDFLDRSDVVKLANSVEEESIEEVKPVEEESIEEEKPVEEEKPIEVSFDEKLIYSLEHENYQRITHKFSHLGYIYRTIIDSDEWREGLYYKPSENFYRMYYNVEKLKDGEHRRKKLYFRMLERIYLSNFSITPDELLYSAYLDLTRFIDNNDKSITVDCLKKNVINALSQPREKVLQALNKSIEFNKLHKPNIILKNTKGLGGRSGINKTLKECRYIELDKIYNSNLTVKENLENIRKEGFNCCEKTLYNYLSSREGLTKAEEKQQRNDFIREVYNSSLSFSENVRILKEKYNIKTSKTSLQRIIKEESKTVKEEVKPVEKAVYVKPIITVKSTVKEEEKPVEELLKIQFDKWNPLEGWNPLEEFNKNLQPIKPVEKEEEVNDFSGIIIENPLKDYNPFEELKLRSII